MESLEKNAASDNETNFSPGGWTEKTFRVLLNTVKLSINSAIPFKFCQVRFSETETGNKFGFYLNIFFKRLFNLLKNSAESFTAMKFISYFSSFKVTKHSKFKRNLLFFYLFFLR